MARIFFADEKVEKAYKKLKQSQDFKQLYKYITRALSDIQKNYACGIFVPKKLIPKVYIRKYEISNLYKYDLPAGWRLFYSVEKGDIEVIAIILEWMNHKDYEKRLGYRVR